MAVPSPLPSDKRTIRAVARAARDALGQDRPAIVVPAAFRSLLRPAMIVASYVPFGSEADPSPLAQAALEAGCAIALPYVVDRATQMRFLSWKHGDLLAAGPYGLQQPSSEAAEVAPDLIITPLVAFDRGLGRVGQGAGYYDRAFAHFPQAFRVGIAYSVQEVAQTPADPWDVPLHAIVTEKEWITP